LKALGIPSISRKQLANKHIPHLAKEANVATKDVLLRSPLVDASSDGWRKRYCEQSIPLNNIVALLPDRALFHDAVNCSTMRKDSVAIAQFLETAAASLVRSTELELERLVGWVLDNTKSIWRAMLTLQKEHPKWIMRGCSAHGLNLLMKELCKFQPGYGCGAGERTHGLKWAEVNVKDANTIANFLQDSGPARQQVIATALDLHVQPSAVCMLSHIAERCVQ
jgi:hypothetical protein